MNMGRKAAELRQFPDPFVERIAYLLRHELARRNYRQRAMNAAEDEDVN
jgi:hypothetical protein